MRLQFDEFPLFVRLPGKRGKYVKINANRLYSNSIPFRWRALIKERLSLFVKSFLKKRSRPLNVTELQFFVFAPFSLGTITAARLAKENADPDKFKYVRWDLTNFSFLWQKVIEDVLVEYNYLADDDVKNVKKISWEFVEAPFKERKITVILK